jgi:hypothetical protein
VLELSVAEKDLQVKLAARQAYLKQSEYMFWNFMSSRVTIKRDEKKQYWPHYTEENHR